MDNTERFIPVQICYAEPENQILIDLEVPENTRLIVPILKPSRNVHTTASKSCPATMEARRTGAIKMR